jgi:hypothetical protein
MAALVLLTPPIVKAAPLGYGQTNLVSDIPGMAQVTDSNLNGPWGMAIAPSNFGAASNDLLVGNFGDATNTNNNGTISVFDPTTHAYLGALSDSSGHPIAIPGLWSLTFGNGGAVGPANDLFFTTGINNQTDGLFGVLAPVPSPTSAVHAGLALLFWSIVYGYRRCRPRKAAR